MSEKENLVRDRALRLVRKINDAINKSIEKDTKCAEVIFALS